MEQYAEHAVDDANCYVQGHMMLHVRRLTALTKLSLAGFLNLVGDAPVAALATSLPPNLAMLQLAGLNIEEVGTTGCTEADL